MLGLLVAILVAVLLPFPQANAAVSVQTRVTMSNNNFATPGVNHQVSFVTASDVPDGQLRFLVPAIAPTASASDQVADPGFYDFGSATVICPQDVPGFTFTSSTATPVSDSLFTYQARPYHVFACNYTGAGLALTDFGIESSNSAQVNGLINPDVAPTYTDPSNIIVQPDGSISVAPHTPGEAYFTHWLVQQVDQYGKVISSLEVWPGYIEDVQVNVNLSPYFTFTVAGVSQNTPACGLTTMDDTTATLVDFGEIADQTFVDLAQELYVATNYPTGYVVTIQQNDQMSRIVNGANAVCPGSSGLFDDCLPNATVLGMTPTAARAWTSYTQGRGLAYTLQNLEGGDTTFNYQAGFRHLPDTEAAQAPVAILKSLESNEARDYVCYRLNALDTNLPGDYTNEVTYTATASF